MNNNTSEQIYRQWLAENAQSLYENAPFGYLVTQPKGLIFNVNQLLLNWLGYHKTELIHHKKFQDLLSVGGKIYYETHHGPLEDLQGFTNELSYNLITKDRKRIPVLVNTQVYTHEEDKALFTQVFIYDIKDRKKYEKELLLAKKKAEEAIKTKAAFLSTVSHEIRTPMNAIIGTTDLLLKNEYLPQQLEMLQILSHSAQNLLTLINNVLDLSKQDANRMLLERKNMNLEQNVNYIINSWQAKAREKGLKLQCEFDENIPKYLVGDAVKIGQVLNNLLGNAIKFTDTGKVMLTVQQKRLLSNQVEIFFAVQDTGIGIPLEKQAMVFEAFRQADESISTSFGGTGLGLAISQNIIRLHGSQLQVESQAGEGATFFFSLLLKIGQAPKVNEAVNQKQLAGAEIAPLYDMKLLLVEDNESNIFIASSYFKRWQLDFDLARNGLEALNLIQKNDYDLVFMDLKMPVMNGYQATAAIRKLKHEKYQKLPIIALSASTKGDIEFEQKRKDFDDFLSKPFDPTQLYQFIAKFQQKKYKPTSETLDSKNSTSPPPALQKMEEMLDGNKEAILSFIPVLTKDLEEAKSNLMQAISDKDIQHYTQTIHKNNTVFSMLETPKLNELLGQAKKVLNVEITGNLEVLSQEIESEINYLVAILHERQEAK